MKYKRAGLLIGGRWQSSSDQWADIVSPSTETPIGRVRRATTDDIDAAVSAARRAFDDGPWRRLSTRIAREEIFGPVAVVLTYEDPDEAVAIANDSPYGLHGGVFTADDERGVEIARRLVTGMVSVNSFTINSDAPFGGRKSSGFGFEFGPQGIASFLAYKTINVPESVASAPRQP